MRTERAEREMERGCEDRGGGALLHPEELTNEVQGVDIGSPAPATEEPSKGERCRTLVRYQILLH